MKLSKKSEYGLRALLELTITYGTATIQRHEISTRQHIPVEFLEQPHDFRGGFFGYVN